MWWSFLVLHRLAEKAGFLVTCVVLGLRYVSQPPLPVPPKAPAPPVGKSQTRPALFADMIVPTEFKEQCPDRLGIFPGSGTLPDLLAHWNDRAAHAVPELQMLRRRRYFIVALQRDVANIFPAWQREIAKVIYALGDETFSNVFVSMYESRSLDVTRIELDAFESLLEVLAVPHRVVVAPEETGLSLDRRGLSRIEFLARLRNEALRPLFESEDEYDVVLYLNDVLFCAADALDLLQVVQPGGGIDADMSCATDYVPREHGMLEQDEIRLYDTWVAHDMLGINMVNDHPYMCHEESQTAFDRNAPFEVFSCWNGMVAIDADVFQRHRLRFRAAHQYECQMSECELIVRDIRALDRRKIVMVPTARTAYSWEAWRLVSALPNPGLPVPLALASEVTLPEPVDAVCCSLDRGSSLVLMESCLKQRRWRLSYELFGIPVAPRATALDASFSRVPEDERGLIAAAHKAFAKHREASAIGVSLQSDEGVSGSESGSEAQEEEASREAFVGLPLPIELAAIRKHGGNDAFAGVPLAAPLLGAGEQDGDGVETFAGPLPLAGEQQGSEAAALNGPAAFGDANGDAAAFLRGAGVAEKGKSGHDRSDSVQLDDEQQLLTQVGRHRLLFEGKEEGGADAAVLNAAAADGTAVVAAAAASVPDGIAGAATSDANASQIPRLLVHWGGEAHMWADDARNLISLSMLSYVGANRDLELRLVDDAHLSDWIASAATPWGEGVRHAYRNPLVRQGCDKLRYIYERGGVYVPTASWAGRPFSEVLGPGDEFVLGVAEDVAQRERHLLFLAASPRNEVVKGMLERVEATLRLPAATYRKAWQAAPAALWSADQLEQHWFTGVEMMLEVAETFEQQKQGKEAPSGIRILRYALADVKFEVARPEAICSGVKARAAARVMADSAADAGVPHFAAFADGGAAGESPVHFDPGVPFQVLFRGHLVEQYRLGIKRNVARDSIGYGRQLVEGQYLLPFVDPPNAPKFESMWHSHPVDECKSGGSSGGRCFLWLAPGGQLTVYTGMGLLDPNAEPVKNLVPAGMSVPNATFSWLVLQIDGNVVLYNALPRSKNETDELDALGPGAGRKPLAMESDHVVSSWSSLSRFAEDCPANSNCRELADLVFRPDGSVELRRGMSETMRTYVEYGMPAVRRLRSCIFRSNFTLAGPPEAFLPPSNSCYVPPALGLITFPNSGTSFTLDAAMDVTGHNVYTSYENEAVRTDEFNDEMQLLCGLNACRDFGMCQLGAAMGALLPPPRSKGALLKSHVTNYGAGFACNKGSEAKFREYLEKGAFEKPLKHYGYLRLFRNPYDNIVARYRMIAEQGKLPGRAYDRESFLSQNGAYPKRDIHTFLNWHLLANRAMRDSKLPSDVLAYEDIYIDPRRYLLRLVKMMGWQPKEIAAHRLQRAMQKVHARGITLHRGEMLPVYIDSFYDTDTVRAVAAAIHAVLDRTKCLTSADYLTPDVGPIEILNDKTYAEMIKNGSLVIPKPKVAISKKRGRTALA